MENRRIIPYKGRQTKAELVTEISLLRQEVQNWQEGTRESVASEDYNRELRWQAEIRKDAALQAKAEAEAWTATAYQMLQLACGPLEVARLRAALQDAEDKLEVAMRENNQLQRRIDQGITALRGWESLLDDE